MLYLDLYRNRPAQGATIGTLKVEGRELCRTLEPEDRGLTAAMSLQEIKRRKVIGFTAVPAGDYLLRLVYSPKFSPKTFYNSHGGMLPMLEDVPGFSRVLIHCGNYPKDTQACVLVGLSISAGSPAVYNSRLAWSELMEDYLLPCRRRGEDARLRIHSALS